MFSFHLHGGLWGCIAVFYIGCMKLYIVKVSLHWTTASTGRQMNFTKWNMFIISRHEHCFKSGNIFSLIKFVNIALFHAFCNKFVYRWLMNWEVFCPWSIYSTFLHDTLAPFSHWSTSTGRMRLAPNISDALICQSPLLFPSAFWWSNYAQTVLTPVVISMTYICWFYLLAWTFSQYFLLLHKIKFLLSKLLPLGLWAD